MIAGEAYICENTNGDAIAWNNKAVGIASVVQFLKRGDGQAAQVYRLISFEWYNQVCLYGKPAVHESLLRDVNGYLIFLYQPCDASNVIGMLMRDKDRLYFLNREFKSL